MDLSKIYSLKHKDTSVAVTRALLYQTLIFRWADLLSMSNGSYHCTAAGRAGGSVLHIEDDGSMNLNCLSQLPIYLPCDRKTPYPTHGRIGGRCPFGYHDGKG